MDIDPWISREIQPIWNVTKPALNSGWTTFFDFEFMSSSIRQKNLLHTLRVFPKEEYKAGDLFFKKCF